MGALAKALSTVSFLFPERKTTVGSLVPSWEQGNSQTPRYFHQYWKYGLEGYGRNEICFAAVEELATSAAEPRLCVVRKTDKGPEQEHEHPVLDLFETPNPFTSRYQLIAALIMYRAIAGSAYLEIGRSAAGKAVELWPLRPDRMFVIPDQQRHIAGWEYRLGDLPSEKYQLRAEDVIQTKTRNPVDDWYGLPPLAVCAERVDTDAMMRSFTLSFFRNAGVPAGLLNITKQVTAAERQVIRDRLRNETGGPQNWHQMLVLDNTEASYTPMGMPLGGSGIVLPELDEISEARIAMAFGVPLELIGARLGMVHGNRSTTLAARGSFWDETLVPLYQELAADFTRGLKPEYDGTPDEFDYLEFDLSTVKALAEDDDAKHKRVRDDLAAGLLSVQEARTIIGQEPQYDRDALLMLARGIEPMTPAAAEQGGPATTLQSATTPSPAEQQQQQERTEALAASQQNQPAQGSNGNGNGNGTGGPKKPNASDLAALARLAQGKD